MVDGRKVVDRREELGWTQVQTIVQCENRATQLGMGNPISLPTLQNIEASKHDVSFGRAAFLADVLGFESLDELRLSMEAA